MTVDNMARHIRLGAIIYPPTFYSIIEKSVIEITSMTHSSKQKKLIVILKQFHRFKK